MATSLLPNEHIFVKMLAKRIEEDSLALFAGAGLSISAGYPSWKELLDKTTFKVSVSNLVKPISVNQVSDLAQYAQYFANFRREDTLKQNIADYLNSAEMKSSTLIKRIKRLNFNTIWTTNYDKVIEKLVVDAPEDISVFYREDSLRKINNTRKVKLFKVHGDVDDSPSILITKSELDKERKLMMTFLKRDLVAYNFLFIGYSFSDQLILKQLRDIRDTLGDAMREHYAIIIRNKEDQSFDYFIDDLYHRYNIVTLVVDDENNVPEILDAVFRKVRQKNVFISGSLSNPKPEEGKKAYNFCKLLVDKLLKKGMRIHSGFGNKIGRYLATGALFSDNIRGDQYKFNRKFIMMPFASQLSEEQKERHRKSLIDACEFVIFIYGMSSSLRDENASKTNKKAKFSNGTREEYDIALDLNCHVIPVNIEAYESGEIWKELNDLIGEQGADETNADENQNTKFEKMMHLKSHMGKLDSTQNDDETVTDTICEIISEVIRQQEEKIIAKQQEKEGEEKKLIPSS